MSVYCLIQSRDIRTSPQTSQTSPCQWNVTRWLPAILLSTFTQDLRKDHLKLESFVVQTMPNCSCFCGQNSLWQREECYSKECGNPGYLENKTSATKHWHHWYSAYCSMDLTSVACSTLKKHIQTPYLLPIWELSHPIETGFQKYSKWRFSRKRLGWMQNMIETTEVKIANFRSW